MSFPAMTSYMQIYAICKNCLFMLALPRVAQTELKQKLLIQ